MDGLLLGALAAIVLTRASVRAALRRHRRAAVVGVGVAAVTAAAVAIHAGQVGVSGFVPVWGLLPFELAVAVVVTVLATVPATGPGRVLGARPMVWIGRRSYGMYMLHIPVWMLFVHFGVGSMPGTLSGAAMAWGAIAVTFLVAALSYRYLETPAMRWRRRVSPTS
jgi:peptidoglycan/LPS O-acetylase OafA/YrhL